MTRMQKILLPLLFSLAVSLPAIARDDVDHCIALDWTSGGSLDLNPLIAPDPGMPPEIRAGIHVHASEDGEAPRTDANKLPVDTWRNLYRQCLRQGEHTDAYIARRPILPTGTQPLVP